MSAAGISALAFFVGRDPAQRTVQQRALRTLLNPARTYDLRRADPWDNPLPDDPRTWTDEELRAAFHDETLRHPAARILRRLGDESADAERLAAWAVLTLDAARDPLARRSRRRDLGACLHAVMGVSCACDDLEIPF